MTPVLLLCGLLAVVILLALGVPIYLVLTGVATAALMLDGKSVAGIAQHVVDHLNSPALVSVPFFLLAAVLMRGGGVAKALFDAAITWIGWLPGGLALAGVAATALFAAINGSSVATALAMGSLLVPMMIEKGYKPGFAMGLTAAAATLGILIPPSLPLILIGLIAEASIPRLFLAGVIPGLLQAALFAGYVLLVARKVGGAPMPLATRAEFARHNLNALPALLIPVVILGGLYGGFVTLTESAVLGAVVSLLVVVLFFGNRRPREIGGFFVEAVDRTAVVVVIVIGASLLSAWIIRSGLPQDLARWVIDSGLKPWQFLLVLNVILLLMGMFLEGVAIILIVVPVVAPVMHQIGIAPEHFAVVMVINIELALLSPPIGLNLFVMSNVTGRPVAEVLRGTLPFFGLMLGLLLLVTFVPQLSTWLPSVLMPRP
ncbi:TRAP transporter large permease [Pararhodobacter aggregans]|uniref:TRAP transporter large permease n=1 Tax=Pararhodobacter aggregans TaxID=404875 RepID=UPI000D466AD7|nr:TRAP transporter large permease subunit [Pararhodobacter aggregans]PTX02998.1 C4-dicarboxylate transporter DctM subunit [Pararhodobacter aggregans]